MSEGRGQGIPGSVIGHVSSTMPGSRAGRGAPAPRPRDSNQEVGVPSGRRLDELPPDAGDVRDQGRHWSRHAARYDDVFLDPFRPGVDNPLLAALEAVPDPGAKVVADLGCGT